MKNRDRRPDNEPAQWHTLSQELMERGDEKEDPSPWRLTRAHHRDRAAPDDAIGMTRSRRGGHSRDQEDRRDRRGRTRGWYAVPVVMAALMLLGGGVFAYFNAHLWTEATCTTPATCRICGRTEGAAPGHRWTGGDCVSPGICAVCGEAGTQAAGHKWMPATCTAPKTCAVCGMTQGGTAPHTLETRTYNDYGHDKIETEEVCTQCGRVINATTSPLETLLDSQHQRFLLSPSNFYQRLLYGAPHFDELGDLVFDTGTADTSQLGEMAEGFTPPITIDVFDGGTQCATFFFSNYHDAYLTQWEGDADASFNTVTLAMDHQQASTKYAQLPMLLIAACDPTMEAGSAETMLLAAMAFSGAGGVEHNGIFYARVGGYFQATCAGALD